MFFLGSRSRRRFTSHHGWPRFQGLQMAVTWEPVATDPPGRDDLWHMW